jgi:hypothetical protein
MAKLLVIELAGSALMSKALKEDGTFWRVRDVEIAVLKNLFMIAANAQKDTRRLNTCYDMVDEIERITDGIEGFKISPSDLKDFLIPAIEKSADQRPDSWYFARNLFRQIENPKEVEV